MTRQRRMILDELRRTSSHPTADEVYSAVRRKLPRISLGTVYRNLEMLAESGFIERIEATPQRRYDADLEPHVHLRCRKCGCVEDIADSEATARQLSQRPEQDHGFEILATRVEYIGLCPACRPGKTSAEADTSAEPDQ